MIKVTLPRVFYDDHCDRELPGGEVLYGSKLLVRVRLTEEEYDEMMSDATYYADMFAMGAFRNEPEASRVGRSAQSAVLRLQEARR